MSKIMNYKKYNNIGELVDALEKLPRDMKIVTDVDNFEKIGYELGIYLSLTPQKYKKEHKDTFDAFDGCPYSYDAIVSDENGDIEAIQID